MTTWFRQAGPAGPPPSIRSGLLIGEQSPTHAPTTELTRHAFAAWTESLVIRGTIHGADRLSDVLNAREPIEVEGPRITPIGAPRSATHASPYAVLDPFDFDFVLGSAQPGTDPDRAAARRIHKVRYPVLVEGRNFEVRGILHVFAGNAPELVIHNTSTLFLPLTDAVVRREHRIVSQPRTDVVLVNRYSINRILQLDALS